MTLNEFKLYTQTNSAPHHIKSGAAFEWRGKGRFFTPRVNWGLVSVLVGCMLFWAFVLHG